MYDPIPRKLLVMRWLDDLRVLHGVELTFEERRTWEDRVGLLLDEVDEHVASEVATAEEEREEAKEGEDVAESELEAERRKVADLETEVLTLKAKVQKALDELQA